jgi:hypothetical protein
MEKTVHCGVSCILKAFIFLKMSAGTVMLGYSFKVKINNALADVELLTR